MNGVISPIEGIGVADLNIDSLLQRLEKESVAEIFMALPATTEGDTTAYYISKHIKTRFPQIKVTAIARGVSVGNELENTDEITLARSIVHRVEFESTFK